MPSLGDLRGFNGLLYRFELSSRAFESLFANEAGNVPAAWPLVKKLVGIVSRVLIQG